MQNQPILITGTSTGIGKDIALDLCQRGFHVFAGVRKLSDAAVLTAAVNGNLTPLQLDVTDEHLIQSAMAELSEATGGRLYGLINNAGVAPGGPLETTSMSEIRTAMEVNVLGPFALTKAAIPLLRKNGGGRIINIGSISGLIALPGLSCYAATKHALEAFTDSLRVELSQFNIHVSIIEPGTILTPIWDKGATAVADIKENVNDEILSLYSSLIDYFDKASREPKGISAEAVSRIVGKAITSAKPKNRYLVGKDALLLKTIDRLPDKIRDLLLLKELG